MKPLFLDPRKPLPGCTSNDCHACPVQTRLQCHFSGRELLRFFGIALPPFILGGLGIARVNTWLLLPWIGFAVAFFGFIEIRVLCSHCPHYAEPGTRSLQCWANYGMPKLWKYRPGPLSREETIVFFAGGLILAGYPVVLLVIGMQWLLLALFVITVVIMGTVMARLMCARCMTFACPLNRVDQSLREAFFARNLIVDRAWQAARERGDREHS